MFYRPEEGHGLPHNPLNAIVAPRPIGWISTRGTLGDNLAPYSFFNAVAYEPPQVMFASTAAKEDRGDTKDTVAQLREHGVFCVNVVEEAMCDAMNVTSGPWEAGRDEFEMAGLEKAECESIDCPRVARAPAALECKVVQIVRLPGEANYVTFGEVVGVHLRDDCLVDGLFDVTTFHPLARLGYRDYTVVRDKFTLKRPGE
ncbi:flavin reductase family protein [Salipiger sp. P9]|uniref:flavin reductase family protein n=1 Tax=Salipiger pentaromativorans TaxID=2943193 RepID=UPI002157D5EE|nr:flavin reductase family protein [Salipiger pentaromativorans]MCR8547632.1 flavin reductase family protein [Salipiger pentaromativorans]